eukprot:CAMPEP_0201596000 /NCGR_PEP_ID=MMETSP0190_2-20130828/192828_1 /ASSEMBLY_ACC=CAM_ASM_000263 /TAXON_ID=37353 /ORGANISM="Rosalina sp." /LENGTH=194 /DNA_ID=CAMNT_0048056195 /DNA_START=172 /DNA_END=756 /DNA_ORIENTATION=+
MKPMKITQQIMRNFCDIALEGLDASNDNILIPIVVIDNNYYGIEWVLIVTIMNDYMVSDVGVSFRYDINTNTFIGTGIYLDKSEIESKHRLVGLKVDYCKHLRPFSMSKLKFCSEDEIYGKHNNNDLRHEIADLRRQYNGWIVTNMVSEQLMEFENKRFIEERKKLKDEQHRLQNKLLESITNFMYPKNGGFKY